LSCDALYAPIFDEVKKKIGCWDKMELDFAPRNIYDADGMAADPFEGLGKALAHLREQAGYSTQTQASEALKIDKGQLSRWENENPRPTLENLGRLLASYGVSLMELAALMADSAVQRAAAERGPLDEELIRSLTEAIRRVEGRQVEAESRLEQIEKDLGRGTG
jgi:transcriptional regulator with XRE-family HTH domain